MHTRNLWTLIGALCVMALVGLVVLGKGSLAAEVHPDASAPAVRPPVESSPTPRHAMVAAEGSLGDLDSVAIVEATSASGGERVNTSGWTSGIVRGDIQLAVSVLDRIKTITILVEEARKVVDTNGTFHRPFMKVVPARTGLGTPTFEVTDIPFSEYPYVVTVHAPGLNGSRRTVTIDQNTPLVDDIVLAITPGAPFSVLLRDQDAAPYTGLDVRMLPSGEPGGRPAVTGTSDNFGSVVFENVLAGDYQVFVTQAGQSLVEPQTITVQPGHRVVGNKIQGQGHTVTVGRGVTMQLQVSDVRGYGIADASASATATDRVKLTVLEATTDFGGRVEFPHLTPGVWQIDVHKSDFQRSSRMVTIRSGQLPELQQVQLIRLR